MPISDILKLKITKPSLYSLFLTSLGLAILSLGLAFTELLGITEAPVGLIEAILMTISIIGAIIFASGVVYNGFFGSLAVGPIYVNGPFTKAAEFIFRKKIFLIPISLIILSTGVFVAKTSLIGTLLLALFLLTVFVLNFPFLVSYYQLLKNNYLPIRYILEELDQLNKKTLYYSILKEIEQEDEFINIVKTANQEKTRPLVKKVLFQELNNPYLARETVTVLLLNNIFQEENPPKDFSKSVIFWRGRG